MKKPFFEPTDFTLNGDPVDSIEITPFFAAKQANAKLEKEIQSWVTVYGNNVAGWVNSIDASPAPLLSHKARLAFIEELPKKECVHKPIEFQDHVGSLAINPVCRYCNAELKAVWSKK